MFDIVISSVPYIAYMAPTAGPALLKGYLNTQGFTSKAVDLNIDFKNAIKSIDPDIIPPLINYWTNTNAELPPNVIKVYDQLLDEFAETYCNMDTQWLGFGVFSVHSQNFLTDFLPKIKKFNHRQIKIVIGGHGLDILFVDSIKPLIDVYILGEGEIALANLLRGNMDYPGINKDGIQIENLDDIGFSDYSDYNLHKNYDNWYDGPMIQVTGSRGCVRKCTFCDVPYIWKKYRYRSGEVIAKEIIKNHELTGIRHFYFTDSLINGNLKELMNMMRRLSDYKTRTGSALTWGGQWITRNQKGLPKDYYELIKSSGGYNLIMGVETGSDAVRAHMKKQFTNYDLDCEMEKFSEHRISVAFYILLGYPTETEKDFRDTLLMFKRYQKYVADGTIIGVALGKGFEPTNHIPIKAHPTLVIHNDDQTQWGDSISGTSHIENIRRRVIAQKVLDDLGWPSPDLGHELIPLMHKIVNLSKQTSKEMLDKLLQIKNAQAPEEYMSDKSPGDLYVEIKLIGHQGKNYPNVEIYINDKMNFDGEIVDEQILCFSVTDRQRKNDIKLRLKNKTCNDTTVDKNGKIIRDQWLGISEIIINGLCLRLEDLQLVATLNNDKFTSGLFLNDSVFSFYFENPVYKYLIDQKKFYFNEKYKNSDLLIKISKLFDQFANGENLNDI